MTLFRTCILFGAAATIAANGSVCANTPTSENALAVRRIARLWEDRHDKPSRIVIKQQIEAFLATHAETAFRDQMVLMLGDLAILEGDPTQALEYYQSIESEEHAQRAFERRLHCLQRLSNNDAVIVEVEKHTAFIDELNSKTPLPASAATLASTYGDALYQKGMATDDAKTRVECLDKAKHCYERASAAQSTAGERLASVHAMLGEHSKAAQSYISLAEQHPHQAATYLLQAARLQAKSSKKDALETLDKINIETSQSPSHSALNLAALWYELGAYQKLIDADATLVHATSGVSSDRVHLLIGRAAYQLSNDNVALEHLQRLATEKNTLEGTHRQAAILTAITCAQRTRDAQLVDRLARTFLHDYRYHANANQVKLSLAWAAAAQGNVEKAIETYTDLTQTSDDPVIAETATYEAQRLYFQQKEYHTCYEGLHQYLSRYPTGHYRSDVHLLLIETMVQLLANTAPSDDSYQRYKEALVKEVDTAFALTDLCPQADRLPYGLTIATTLLRANCFEAADRLLQGLLTNCAKDTDRARVHLLAAATALSEGTDPHRFITHAEASLKLDPENKGNLQLRLNLFSQHLALSQLEPESEKGRLHLSSAAKHLYDATQMDAAAISVSNRLWLANYYYKQAIQDDAAIAAAVTPERLEAATRSASAFEAALSLDSDRKLKEEETSHESALIKLSRIYTVLDQKDKKDAALKILEDHYTEHPAWKWEHRAEVLLSIADDLRANNHRYRAIRRYQRVLDLPKSESHYPRAMAAVHLARYTFEEMPEQDRTLENAKIVALTHTLAELEQKRTLATEPAHLEAALTRCQVLAACTPQGIRQATALQLLQAVKETFSETDSIWTQEYHAERKASPLKDRTYQAYMMLIDAKIAALQATLETLPESDRRLKSDAAQTLYKTLLEGGLSASEYLIEEAKAGLKNVKAVSLDAPTLFPATSDAQ